MKSKIFLKGEAVECENIVHSRIKVKEEMQRFEELMGNSWLVEHV